MGIDLTKLITFADAARRVGVTRLTVYNWCDHGVNTVGGRVYLDSLRVGGRRFIDPDALAAFLELCNQKRRPQTQPETPAAESRRALEAQKRAAALLGGAH